MDVRINLHEINTMLTEFILSESVDSQYYHISTT